MENIKPSMPTNVRCYAKFLLIMAGLGGLLYGVDVGVIAAALPYIERTSTFNTDEIGWIVGMALWGSLPSSMVAGLLAEWFGRKKMIVVSALLFLVSKEASGFVNGVVIPVDGGFSAYSGV